MLKKILIYELLFLCLFISSAFAHFAGPEAVLTLTYGSANAQVGLSLGDSGDQFPWKFGVSPTGRIALCDEVNRRVVIYKPNGSFERIINRLSAGVVFDSSDSLYFKARFRKYDTNGNLLFEKNVGFNDISVTLNDEIIGYNNRQKTYSLFNSNGELIKIINERPLELGQVKSVKLGENKYKLMVGYPDNIYGLSSDREFVKYVRITSNRVYGINPGGTWRFNQCGKIEGYLLMPDGQMDEIPGEGREEPQVYVNSEYGSPVVASNGDVYTWKRTPEAYSILKWTWVADPNTPSGPDAPSGLTVIPSTSGLYLTWTASPQDPGCVTGYAISRATSAGGVATTVATVNAGVVKYNDTTASVGTTYYYKIRAVAGSEFSPYTTEVSGKR